MVHVILPVYPVIFQTNIVYIGVWHLIEKTNICNSETSKSFKCFLLKSLISNTFNLLRQCF